MKSGPQDKAVMRCGFGFWNTLLQFPVPQQRFHCPRNISKRCCVCAYTRWNPVSLAKLCKQAEEFNHAAWNPLKSYCGQTELNANCRELFSDMFALCALYHSMLLLYNDRLLLLHSSFFMVVESPPLSPSGGQVPASLQFVIAAKQGVGFSYWTTW